MKIVIIVTAGLVAMLSVAAAADLPRKEPPPVAAAPIGKYPVTGHREMGGKHETLKWVWLFRMR